MATCSVKEGYLCKSPPDDKSSVKSWRDRWFVFRLEAGNPILEYFESKSKQKLKGTVPFKGAVQLVSVPSYGRGFSNVFYISTPGRKFYMSAPSREELDRWLQILAQHLNKPIDVQMADGKLQRQGMTSPSGVATPSAPFLYEPPSCPPPSAPPAESPGARPPPPLPSPVQPLPSPVQPLPSGWEQRFEPSGRPYFVNHATRTTQYEDPRIHGFPTTAPPALPTSRPPSVPVPMPNIPVRGGVNQGPLPHGWEQRNDATGRPYFLNHTTKVTQFEDPRVLPPGWEMRFDSKGVSYFVDHNAQTTTYNHPTQQPPADTTKKKKETMSKRVTDIKEKLKDLSVRPSNIKFVKRIGEGAFGEVWLGKVKGLDKDASKTTFAAVKMIRTECDDGRSRDEKEITDFLREAEVMSSFDHPCVVRLLGACLNQMPYLIISEFMNQGDLKFVLQSARLEGRTWPLKLKLLCALQTAEGLLYLNVEKCFVHRDVAARNVLVHEESHEQLQCKITDFGLSRDVYESEYYRQAIGDNKKAFLPAKWMAIESLQDHIYNQKTDVWSFGVLLWEIFAMGMVPYPGVDNRSIWQELSNGLKLNKPADCSGPVYDLITQCTQHLPGKRPTFEQIITRLNEEVEVCDEMAVRDYYNISQNSNYSNVDIRPYGRKATSLTRRISVTDISSIDDIEKLSREEMEDVLHSNFVSVAVALSTAELADKLRSLWVDKKCVTKQ
ncbi:tyrosine-protein kinase HTK16-like isoform X2 [Corticium candelabrum]|uniref:tyrosine-protein kinase HTK16-like isoform X2 n=1 Tax=Corticium candelabrum TaxID=121492 RepID=UPI002E274C8B|nr:tyrosine-protein kinase HTK16-like isoform X2 [Corticium candelabrum]